MYLATKARNVLRGVLQAHGTESVKKWLWDDEFASGHWSGLEQTDGDCVYSYIEKYAAGSGRILDLGCGSGNTSNELAATAYSSYVGVDISDVAIEKARERSKANGRAEKNQYYQSDIVGYRPTGKFDLILFRDSLMYVPWGRIPAVLNNYARHLEDRGVFIVRLVNGMGKYKPIVDAIERNFEVVERHVSTDPDAVILVFRPLPH